MREESAIARIAAQQYGVVSVVQLHEIGFDKSAISRRAASGRLNRVHRGVYAIGHLALSHRGRWLAAVLACEEGAVLSHGSAAALWGLLRPIDGPIDVSIPSLNGRRTRYGIRIHRCSALPSTVRHRIPVTTVQRTIDDLRGAVPPHLVRRARRQAELKGWRLEGAEGRKTRSELEEGFLALCRRHRLPLPETNAKVGRWEVDFLWRDQRLAVETDCFAYHRGSVAFHDDHARDLDLRGEGFIVLRFSEHQIEEEPDRVAADVARGLASR
jgi:very-short-patch-repair endonuclease